MAVSTVNTGSLEPVNVLITVDATKITNYASYGYVVQVGKVVTICLDFKCLSSGSLNSIITGLPAPPKKLWSSYYDMTDSVFRVATMTTLGELNIGGAVQNHECGLFLTYICA